MKRLIVISAPSGAGKTTLCQRLLKDFSNLSLSVSTTTRAPRGNEKHGIDYFFSSKEDFEKGISDHRFAEWAKVHDNYYGTSKDFLEICFQSNQAVLLDIDVQGAASLLKSYPNDTFTIFIAPPDMKTLEERLRSRKTDSEESIQKRIRNAQSEMQASHWFQKKITNDDLERAYGELKSTVEAALKS